MKKYLTITTAVIFAVSMQTFLFAKDSSKTEAAEIAFEQLLNTKDFASLLNDSTSIALEKILLSPTQRVYNDLTKSLNEANKAKNFKANITNVNNKALNDIKYAQAVPEAYYQLYADIVANPNISADFNLTKPELTKVIYNYQNRIIDLLKDTYAFKIEKRNNPNLTLSGFVEKVIGQNVSLLSQYYKANPNISLYDGDKETNVSVNIKAHKQWPSAALHQEMLIKAAALRVIEANLRTAKAGLTYDLSLFDIVSIARVSKTETRINFDNGVLTFALPQEAYKYIPFNTKKLVSRDAKFITALQEIEKKKQNPNYDFATKRDSSKQAHDYYPVNQPIIYDVPWGTVNVK